MVLKNDLILRAAKGEKTERIPVWMMRQAGRILPEYRAVRAKMGGFKELVKSPEFAAEVTIQPVDILDVDAAIIFSDILVIPEALGFDYDMIESKGPSFPRKFESAEDMKLLVPQNDALDKLHYVPDAIKMTVSGLNGRVPLIGFAGAPFTIFTYMTEGGGSKTFSRAKKFLYTQPEVAHQLLQRITDLTIEYLKMQIRAGANMVQVFDSWASVLSPHQYAEFGTKYVKDICMSITEVPVTVFAKGAYHAMADLSQSGASVLGLDWLQNPAEVRNSLKTPVTLQGNLDPCALYADFKTIEFETKEMLRKFGAHRTIANLGHGVYPDTHPDHVKCFIETVKNYTQN
jgi:uroporphyrinogen decarboxylase